MNQLLKQAQRGDKSAEDEIYKKLFVRFCYLAKLKVGERVYEDIAQDACLTVLEKYRDLTESADFASWANRILRNKIGNYYQKRATERRILVKDDELILYATSENTNPQLLVAIKNCLRKILSKNAEYHRILKLVYQGYTTEEISQKLNIQTNNVYVRLNRSRQMLKDCLNQ